MIGSGIINFTIGLDGSATTISQTLCYLKLPLPQIFDLVAQFRRALELQVPRSAAHVRIQLSNGFGQFFGAVLFVSFQIDRHFEVVGFISRDQRGFDWVDDALWSDAVGLVVRSL